MIQDDPIVRLGQSQQKVMSLSVEKRALEKRLEVAEHRAEVLEELVTSCWTCGIVDKTRYIRKVMQKLDGEDQ
jgi:hypothetical protein